MKSKTELHALVENSPRLMPLTKRRYLKSLDRWIEFAGADPRGWTRDRAAAWYRHLLDSGIKVNSAATYMAAIQYAAKWYAHQHGRPDLDFSEIEMSRAEPRAASREALSPEEAIAILNTTATDSPIDLRDRAMIVVALETGMRCMSLQGMQLHEIVMKDFALARVPIKGARELYEVPLSDVALLGMEPWRRWLRNHKIGKGEVFRSLVPHIDERGKRLYTAGPGISKDRIYQIIVARADKTEIGRRVHPHIFRHTYVTSRFGLLNPFQIAAMTGHQMSEYGQLHNYADLHKLGGEARLVTPSWLSDWCARVCR